ncbi:MAG: pentapeptide repeat-containing protein [Thalassobaculum sp.]|uniref:pentapeptide repeat-containing protein n=1 Tax=Thalassobaculum sp. TaxID=2022740 RepID=UPI0032F0134D
MYCAIVCAIIAVVAYQALVELPELGSIKHWAGSDLRIHDVLISVGTFLAVPLLLWRIRIADRHAEASHAQAEASHALARSAGEQVVLGVDRLAKELLRDQSRLVAERFERAVELFGHDKASVRLGAVFAFEQVARVSPEHASAVRAIVAAWLRDNIPPFVQGRPKEPDPDRIGDRSLLDILYALLRIPAPLERGTRSFLDLRELNFVKADLQEAQLEGARLDRARLHQANLHRAVLIDACLKEADCWGSDLSGASLVGADLQAVRFRKADLAGAQLTNAKAEGADLSEANLTAANLSGAALLNADLTSVRAERADISKAKLDGARLIDADLRNSDLRGASLVGASLVEARLAGVKLNDAILRDCILSNADLSGACMDGIDAAGAGFDGAVLTGARLHGAKLGEAIGLGFDVLKYAEGDERTELPADLSRPDHWRGSISNPGDPLSSRRDCG